MTAPTLVPPGTVARGQHACAIYRSAEEHWEVTAGFVAAGLTRGERVLCIDDDGTAEAVLRRLTEDGLDARPHLAGGQLVVTPVALPLRGAGFSAQDLAADIEAQVDDALADGYQGLRLAFETGSVLRETGDVEWLLRIDAACAPMWHTGPVSALCQFDDRLIDPARRATIRARHEWEVGVPADYDDGLLRITGEGRGRRRLAGEVDLGNREALQVELDRALADGCREMRLSVASLRFADAGSVRVLADAATRLQPGRRLVLERPTALLRRVLGVCALDRLPGLVIEPDEMAA